MEKPELPNPGNGRYWDISVEEGSKRLVLTLRSPLGGMLVEGTLDEPDYYTNGTVVGSEQTYVSSLANELILRQTRAETFVGSYKFEETN